MERTKRRRIYFTLMGICIALIVLAWNVVRFWSTTAAIVMSVVAAVIPPVAAFLGNRAGRHAGLNRAQRSRGVTLAATSSGIGS